MHTGAPALRLNRFISFQMVLEHIHNENSIINSWCLFFFFFAYPSSSGSRRRLFQSASVSSGCPYRFRLATVTLNNDLQGSHSYDEEIGRGEAIQMASQLVINLVISLETRGSSLFMQPM